MVFLDPSRRASVLARFPLDRRGWQGRGAALRAFAGPTFVASVANVDPGNFATNIDAGARLGYRLLWVVLLANLMAMLFQALAAKLGIVTGRSLARVCHDRLPVPLVRLFWAVSEIGAMATDLAEFLGASVGFALFLGTSLFAGTLLAGGFTWAILSLQQRRLGTVELIATAFTLLVGLCFVIEMPLVAPDWRLVADRALAPSFGGADGMLLAAGIVGATLMPHALFLHSSIAARRLPARDEHALRRLVSASNLDIAATLGGVSLINMAMLCVAAAGFGVAGAPGDPSIENAYRLLGPLFGGMAGAVLLISLLASGLSSSVIGTMAGQIIMQDFVDWRIPLWLRRLVTMLPTVMIAAFAADATRELVLSQVVLCFVLPVPLVTLVLFTSSPSVMGGLANGWLTRIGAVAATLFVLALNALLLFALLD